MIYLLHHDCDAFELCHALWAMRVTRRPPTQVTLSRRGQGCVCHLHKQSTGLFSPRPRGIACYTLIEGSSTAPKHARMRAHGVWRVQTVTSVTQEFESENCVVCATICKYLIICSFPTEPPLPATVVLPELDVAFVATGGGNRGAGAVTGAADLHSHTSKPQLQV